MSIIRHRIDSYTVKIYGNDLGGTVARWAAKEIHLFSGGRNVASAYFARPGHVPPDATLSDDKIIFNASEEQYAPVLDLLRHEKAVFVAWVPHSDRGEKGDGNAVIFTGTPHPPGE